MRNWTVEYTTDKENRRTDNISASNYTEAYLEFTFRSPSNYEIISITEN